MRAHYFQKGIPLLFLFLFLGVKAFAFHPLTHDESEETTPCEVCTLVIQHELEDFDNPEILTIEEETPWVLNKEEEPRYIYNPYQRAARMWYFSRPPPQYA